MSEPSVRPVEITMMFSEDSQYYAIPAANRECGLWLSVETHPLPVPLEWRRPGINFAAVIRTRDYYRLGSILPHKPGRTETISPDDDKFSDYRDAAWWTPGLEEAWASQHALRLAVDEANRQISQLTPSVKEDGRGRKA